MRKIKRFMTLALAIVLLCGTALPAHAYGGLFGGGKKPKPGDRVEVSADDRSSEGLVFDHWEANTDKVVFNDPYSPHTWFIVPEGMKEIDINPVFRGVTPEPTAEPTPEPKPGERVEITAPDRSSEGLVFDHWEANTDKVVFNDPYSPNTWFIVPDGVKDIDINPVFRGVTPVPTVEPTPKPTPRAQTGEISDSWEQIIAAIDDGSAQQRYAIGATKELKLSGIGTIHMQLAGFDLDERADGNGKAPTTWIAVELLPEKHLMNSESTSDGGWQDSDLRAYLHDTLLPTIPEAVQKRLMCVKKQQRDSYDGHHQTTEDMVWIPDYDEVFGKDSLYYDLFRNSNEKRVKRCEGSAAWWWLRAASSYGSFNTVNNNGYNLNYDGAHWAGGVALGFCL